MSGFGNVPTSDDIPGYPLDSIWNEANGSLIPIRGIRPHTDSNGKTTIVVEIAADSGNFATGAIVDLATLLTLAGTSGDASTVASIMGRLTKIRDLLNATLSVSAASLPLPSGASTEATLSSAKSDLDTIVANTNKIPASPAQEGGNLATLAGIVSSSKAATKVTTAGDIVDGAIATLGLKADSADTSSGHTMTLMSAVKGLLYNTGLGQSPKGGSMAVALSSDDSRASGDAATASNTLETATGLYNGATVDRMRGNLDNISLINASNVSSTQTSADQTNYNAKGVKVWWNITTFGASLTLNIQYKDPVSGQYITALSSAAIGANTFTQYTIYPGITASANVALSDILPRTWRVQVTGASGSTFTVGSSIIN